MSDLFALVGTFRFESAKRAAAWRRASIPGMSSWERAHHEWLRAGGAGKSVAEFVEEATARDDGPFFLRITLEDAELRVYGYLGEDLPDWLGPLAGALRAAAPSATGELTIVGLAGAPSARLVLAGGKARFSDDDVGTIDEGATMAAIDAARRGEKATAPTAPLLAHADASDVAIFAQLLFPLNGGRSGRKWAASTIAPALDLARLEPLLFEAAFLPHSPAKILAEAKTFVGGPGEWLAFHFNNDFELKLQALLGRSRAFWLPRLAATLRSANAFGAQGDLVVLPLSGTTATVVELRKNTVTRKGVDEKALQKSLGWPVRKSFLQERTARAKRARQLP